MGRGRAKAKQTKVARELKYSSPTTDYEALQRELSGDNRRGNGDSKLAEDLSEDAHDDEYSQYDQYRR